ncbi:zinc finger FYVE domain-containing protein 1 isoform X1 [Parasteatoda tepidariorum]|uniref:zinc finger FYVE domain-containing protein 1 isoform X1 n=1 Tax=Parasteatoda tepidariorum TaxID=114398 RepID=UPI001C71DA97|nr:zinc finger FYVE domain-containing protein 1 isoform X1 [Parasteatoda tepidariorum]
MSAKTVSANSRLIKFKALRVRSSRKICDERLACRGIKPYAVFNCKECGSNQCEACEALLHEDFRLNLHNRQIISGPPADELCEGNCEDRNFADLTCSLCNRNFCLVCDHLIHTQSKQNHVRTKFTTQAEEFLSCDEIPDEYLPILEQSNDPGHISINSLSTMMSLSSNLNDGLPDLFPEHEVESKYGLKSSKKSTKDPKSFLLINDKELLQVKDAEHFIEKLGCGSRQLKVVSIFGNTGDGKSYTLNHTFFDGREIFRTSASQESCTVGVWAAYCPSVGIVTVDTEGFLGQASNTHTRARMLLKVLAISDVVIYRTRAERLHNDMFSFLGDASSAYTKHFTPELEEASARCNVDGPISVLGPSVIIFHETRHTEVLSNILGPSVINFHEKQHADVISNIEDTEPELILRSRFQENGLKVDAFSSLEYLGIHAENGKSDFVQLRQRVVKLVQNSSVRVARSPSVIFTVLKTLNEKFSGNLEKTLPNTFPDQYFTCSAYCKSCKSRCSNSMNHEKDDIPHSSSNNCIYQHQFENRVFLCKVCFERGEKITVTPEVMESNDSSWMGIAKYAWSGYILECAKCGVIYRSRQYWYGNQNPWDTCVRTEICHIWPEPEGLMPKPQNTAQYVIDNITTVSEIVSNIGAKPTKVLSSWVADQIAPSYWIPNSRITHCGNCPKEFDDMEKKHHCRACGGGFCEDCASKSRIVPTWGSSPVRVCDKCFNNDGVSVSDNLSSTHNLHNPPEVTVRKLGEAVHTTLETVASAVSYPIGFIKDSARPTYWVPDHLLKECFVCKNPFGPKLLKHHCRSCGEGVCKDCSKSRKPVHSRGWEYPVRVCDTCVNNGEI